MIKDIVETMTLYQYRNLTLKEACYKATDDVLGLSVLRYTTVNYDKIWEDVQKVHYIKFLIKMEEALIAKGNSTWWDYV